MTEFNRVVLLFFIYSFIGWLWETVYCSLKAKKFVYRGFLVGPYCPIYGFGVLSVLYFVKPYQNNIIVLYFFSAILVTVLEYLTSYVLEKLFHATWWDYKDVPLNINGRVAVPVSLFWGLGCLLIVEVIHPQVLILEQSLQKTFGAILPLLLTIVLISDLIYTVVNMVAFKKAMAAWSEAVEVSKAELSMKKEQFSEELSSKKEQLQANRSEWLQSFKDQKDSLTALPKINFNHRRMLNSFSRFDAKHKTSMKDLREAIKARYDRY